MGAMTLDEHCIVLDAKLAATPVVHTPTMYQELDARFAQFQGCVLLSQHRFTEDWTCWEMHPHGDEVLYLLAGAASLYLYVNGAEQCVEFRQTGSVLVIPKGVWHTAKVEADCMILFITPGEGTRNGPDPRTQSS